MKLIQFAAAVVFAFTSTSAIAGDISGAGATFPYPIYAKWADAYKKETGTGLNYQSIGSGGGIKQITAKTVTFGASDKPLKADELAKGGDLVQFPTVIGGVVPVITLSGIEPNQLVLDGVTLAKIFLGDITSWNDPAIAKLNPGIKLPDVAIAVVHRSDGSGTSFNFTYYLAQVSKDWADKIGADQSVQWPTGIGAKGNEGVAANVAGTIGSIGYVEYAYAKQNHMTTVGLINKAGNKVFPTAEAFAAAAAGADWSKAPGFYLILADQSAPKAWPMTAATFILVHKVADDGAAVGEALKFFDWAYAKGDQMAADLDYVPMPDNVVSLVKKEWAGIKGADGKAVYK